jgi:hypothetical protein
MIAITTKSSTSVKPRPFRDLLLNESNITVPFRWMRLSENHTTANARASNTLYCQNRVIRRSGPVKSANTTLQRNNGEQSARATCLARQSTLPRSLLQNAMLEGRGWIAVAGPRREATVEKDAGHSKKVSPGRSLPAQRRRRPRTNVHWLSSRSRAN